MKEEAQRVEGLDGIRLAIATPFYSVMGFSPYISALFRTIMFLERHTDVDVDFWELSGDSYVWRARNSIAKRLLESDRTHLFFIDSDEAWDLAGFLRVLVSPGDIVGAGYPCKNVWDFYGCILNTHDDGRPIVNEHGLLSAWIAPAGFLKVHRSVFERLLPHVEHRTVTDPHGDPQTNYGFFDHISGLGEDGSFNMRCQTAGIMRWIQPDVTITHFGMQGHTGNYHEWLQRLPGGAKGPPLEEEEAKAC